MRLNLLYDLWYNPTWCSEILNENMGAVNIALSVSQTELLQQLRIRVHWPDDIIQNSLRCLEFSRFRVQHIRSTIFSNAICLNENVWISIEISLNFVLKGSINNIRTLVHTMAWHRPGDKPLSEPMMLSLLTHICVTQPQWVKITVVFLGDHPNLWFILFGYVSLVTATGNTKRVRSCCLIKLLQFIWRSATGRTVTID